VNVKPANIPNDISVLKEGNGVRQKHNCLGFVFIAAKVTTCFGRAWPWFMNHTQESPGILQQLQQTTFFCNTPHRKK
jgi:hypothetical protein